MSTQDDGGSAFPQVHTRFEGSSGDYDQIVESAGGMSLRDYFAAKAMAAFIAEPVDGVQEAMFYGLSDTTCNEFAKSAYKMANAMLKARNA